MNPTACNDNDPVFAFVQICSDELERQADEVKGWPDPLRLPAPESDAERHALRLFLAALEERVGVPLIQSLPSRENR